MTEPSPGSSQGDHSVPADAGTIALHLQGSIATSNVISPTVTVNGHLVQTSYGLNQIPMPPGRHHLEVHSQWLRRFGQASIDVDVHTGQSVPVYYATPWHQFTTGSIGLEKQKKKGAAFFFVLVGTVGVLAGVVAALVFS